MSEYGDAKNYFQRLVNFSSASVYKDMLHHAIAAFDRAEAAEAEVERLKGVLVEQVKQYPDYSDICRKALGGDAS